MPLTGYQRLGLPAGRLGDNGMGGHAYPPALQVPAYGTLLSQNNVRDVYLTIQENGEQVNNGQENYNTYADGLGGSFDQTNYWSLPSYGQQLSNTSLSYYNWETEYNYDIYQYRAVNGKYSNLYAFADGGGGYYTSYVDGGSYINGGQVSGSPTYNFTDQTSTFSEDGQQYPNGKYIYDGFFWEVDSFGNGTGNVVGMSGIDGGDFYADGTFFRDVQDSYPEVPSGSGNYFFDGNDNRWEWNGVGAIVFRYSGLYSFGTFITNYQDYNYYWDGAGGYYQGEYTGSSQSYPSSGTVIDSGGGSSSLSWNAPDGSSGTFTYSSWGYTTYADGNGGSWTSSGGWSANYGDVIQGGSYQSQIDLDENGNPIYVWASYSICYDGNGGYYTNYY